MNPLMSIVYIYLVFTALQITCINKRRCKLITIISKQYNHANLDLITQYNYSKNKLSRNYKINLIAVLLYNHNDGVLFIITFKKIPSTENYFIIFYSVLHIHYNSDFRLRSSYLIDCLPSSAFEGWK